MRAFLLVLLTSAFSLLLVAPVHAASHYYGEGELTAASTATNYLGGYSQWLTPAKYTTTDSGGFTEETIWVGTQNSSTWAETGLTMGWSTSTTDWTMYWAEFTPTYNEYKVTTISPGATGTNHRYQIQYDSYKKWGVYIDYTKVGTSTQSAGTMFIYNGSEVTKSANTLTATYPSYMQCLKAGTWTYWKSCGGSLTSTANTPYKWKWLDTTYKFGESYE